MTCQFFSKIVKENLDTSSCVSTNLEQEQTSSHFLASYFIYTPYNFRIVAIDVLHKIIVPRSTTF